ncbi:B12-binding domain-containing radical SAM protein [Nitrospinota bacterium]
MANYVSARVPYVRTEILDLSTTPIASVAKEIERKVKTLRFESSPIIGITTTTASYQAALKVARSFKDLDRSCTVVFGGHHASSDAEMVLRMHPDCVDVVIIGEGEKALAIMLEKFPDLSQVPGAAFLNGVKFCANPVPPFLDQMELDNLQLSFNGNGLIGTPGKFGHVTYVSARGCPLQCAFCSVANEKMRAKNVCQVVKDICELAEMGFSQIAIEDNFFAHSPSRTEELCLGLASIRRESRIQFSWDCQTRLESMARPGVVPLFAAAGCKAVYIGVESLNSDHLLYMKKTRNPKRYVDLLLTTVAPSLFDSSVDCYINLQFGIPGEKLDHERNTINLLSELGSMALSKGKTVTIFPQLHVVYPGTAHFACGILEGRFPRDVFETFTAWEAEQDPVLFWLGEHFAHGTGGLPEGILISEKLKKGIYEVDVGAVCRISGVLKTLDRISGISVFPYGQYLVKCNSMPFNQGES